MKPKQLIATNGNPNGAVAPLAPDTISQGTVPLLELLQGHKEQATGLSKAAQGLNDTLFVSGNSEEKMQRAMSAAQVRIQYMARRFVETGVHRLVLGIYKMVKKHITSGEFKYSDSKGYFQNVDVANLPDDMLLDVDADVGDNSNSNVVRKMQQVGGVILPALKDAGAGAAINPMAALTIAKETIAAMDLDPLDFLEDFMSPDFQQKAEQSRQNEMMAQQKAQQIAEQIQQLDIKQRESTIALSNIQSKNQLQDNMRQMVVAMDKHHQEWGKLFIEAQAKGCTEMPEKPDIKEMYAIAMQIISMDATAPINSPTVQLDGGPAAAANATPPDQAVSR
jgi:hypothetical protein